MQGILDQIGSTGGILLISTSTVVLGLVLFAVLQAVQLRKLKKKWAVLLNGAKSGNLEKLLQDHLDHTESTKKRLDESTDKIKGLESKMESSKRYIGVFRYDAFDDVGGSQSFSMAIYDEQGDGVVLTSQVGRADCRVFAKEMRSGKSERDLSVEEQRAVEIAVQSRKKVASR